MPVIELDIGTMIFRLVLAAILGGIVGWERERRHKQAGFKTHLLVSLGSALIMLTSIYGFSSELLNHPNARFDPARLSAQVVSGIGFLGAGAILRRSNHMISGLTTAATLWLVAGIGLSVGSGFYLPAIVTTVIILLSIMVLGKIESKFLFSSKSGTLKITLFDRPVKLHELTSMLKDANMTVEQMIVVDETNDENNKKVSLEFRVHSSRGKVMPDLLERIWKVDGVKEVKMNWKG